MPKRLKVSASALSPAQLCELRRLTREYQEAVNEAEKDRIYHQTLEVLKWNLKN